MDAKYVWMTSSQGCGLPVWETRFMEQTLGVGNRWVFNMDAG